MRRCSVCRETKPFSEFAWKYRDRGVYDSYCRPCRSDYKKRHYAANRQRYIANAAFNKARMMRTNLRNVVAYLRKHPCVDCGEADPLVLEFDHLRDKSFEISRKMRDCTWPVIALEIEKCEVVCANCHRRRSAHRGRYARLAAMEPCCRPGRSEGQSGLLWTALRGSMRE